MKLLHLSCALSLLLGLPLSPVAAEPAEVDRPPQVTVQGPELSGPAAGDDLEPEVTIIETARGTVEEYRAGGRLYMVRILPKLGPPYFLLDTDGDGFMDTRRNDPTDISIPQWVIYSW